MQNIMHVKSDQVIRIKDYYIDDKFHYIITDAMQTNLLSYMNMNCNKLTESIVRDIF